MRLVFVAVVLVGCASTADTTDDAEAETAEAQPAGKADALAFTGLYRSHTTHHYNGDVPALELKSGGTYVRARCYGASCATEVSETDHVDQYTSSSGKTYLRFWSWTSTRDDNGDLLTDPLVADVYEVRAFSKGIQLRKSYSTRWQSLYTASASLTCSATGGTWMQDNCTCPGNSPAAWPSTIFVPGAGGCVHNPGASEDGCDSTNGMWCDDDAALTGAYCLCGYGRFLNDDGSCQDL